MQTCIRQSAKKQRKFWPSTTIPTEWQNSWPVEISDQFAICCKRLKFPSHWLSGKLAYASTCENRSCRLTVNEKTQTDLHSPCCFTKSWLQFHAITSWLYERNGPLLASKKSILKFTFSKKVQNIWWNLPVYLKFTKYKVKSTGWFCQIFMTFLQNLNSKEAVGGTRWTMSF